MLVPNKYAEWSLHGTLPFVHDQAGRYLDWRVPKLYYKLSHKYPMGRNPCDPSDVLTSFDLMQLEWGRYSKPDYKR